MLSWVIGACLLLAAPFPQEAKRPIPDAAAQKDAEKLVREVFAADFAKKAPADQLSLARKLLDQGLQVKDEAAPRYVLLREAKTAASLGGDFELALQCVDELGRSFTGDFSEMRSGVLSSAAKNAKLPADQLKLAQLYLTLAQEAAAAEQFAVAEKAAQEASSLARKGKDIALVAKADSKGKEIAERKSGFDKLKRARESLVAKPDDPEANLLVGRHDCFVKGDWETGLPRLAKSSDAVLKDLAAKDLMHPEDGAGQISVGDGWWDLAEKESGGTQELMKTHAREWYTRALPSARGLSKTKLEKRLGGAAPAPAAKTPEPAPGPAPAPAPKASDAWLTVDDPSAFGMPGKAGSALEIGAPGASGYAALTRFPAGDFDAFSCRIKYNPESKALGVVMFERYKYGAAYEPVSSTFCTFEYVDQKGWQQKERIQVDRRSEFVISGVLKNGEYVLSLDGKEMVHQKATADRMMGLGFQVQFDKVLIDQVRLRKRE